MKEAPNAIGPWKKFFEGLELDDVELHGAAHGTDRKGNVAFRGDPGVVFGDREITDCTVTFTISWSILDLFMNVSLDWDTHDGLTHDVDEFRLNGNSDRRFPLKPGVSAKITEWLEDKIEMAFEEIEEEIGSF